MPHLDRLCASSIAVGDGVTNIRLDILCYDADLKLKYRVQEALLGASDNPEAPHHPHDLKGCAAIPEGIDGAKLEDNRHGNRTIAG